MNSPPFAKVYEPGFRALASLKDDRVGLALYIFLCEAADHENVLSATYEVLSEETGFSERALRNASARLQEAGHIVVLPLGTARVYVLNPAEIWKTEDKFKASCSFRTRTLVRRADMDVVRRRLNVFSKPTAATDPAQQALRLPIPAEAEPQL